MSAITNRLYLGAFWLISCLATSMPTQASPPPDSISTLLRFPNTHGDRVVFVAHGNLWWAPTAGGAAHRLTNNSGDDLMPRYSPDGRWIAYTAPWGRNRAVFVIPSTGGEPRQLTFHPDEGGPNANLRSPDNLVVGWNPDSRSITFLSRSEGWTDRIEQLFQVSVSGGLPIRLPLDRAGLMSYSPDGSKIALTRVLADFQDWKRYDGGEAPDLYTYDFQKRRLQQITNWKGIDTAPMWFGNRIYFLSDRDPARRANIWVYDLTTRQSRQVTRFVDYDIDFPSLGTDAVKSSISFQQGGQLWMLDLPSETLRRVNVRVPDDASRTGLRQVDAGRWIQSDDPDGQSDYTLSPHGDRAIFSARGDLFLLDTVKSTPRNLTVSSDADEDYPSISPDGKLVAYVTDRTGERQVAVRPLEGGTETIISRFKGGYFFTPLWSPDGNTMLVADGAHRLWEVSNRGGTPIQVAFDPHANIRDASFSADGNWIAYSTMRSTHIRAVHLHDRRTGADTIISSPMYSDRNPVFSQDGKTLFILSAREPIAVKSESGTDYATVKSDGIFAIRLSMTGVTGSSETPMFDLDEMLRYTIRLPVQAADIETLDIRGSRLVYQTQPVQLIHGNLPGGQAALRSYDTNSGQDSLVLSNLDNQVLSSDGRRVLYTRDQSWRLADLAADDVHDVALETTGLLATIKPREEWKEMFENSWRLERDLFFNPTMNGDNWQGVHDAYAKLLPLAGSRSDLTYLLGQMLGELGNSHMFVGGGDDGASVPSVSVGLLGVDFALDSHFGRYRIAHIYPGSTVINDARSPLNKPDLNVKAGDYLLAVNGKELSAPTNPDSLLVGATSSVKLDVASTASGYQRHAIVVQPVQHELKLRMQSWIDEQRRLVSQLSNGRVGYVYLADMDAQGVGQFAAQFRPQTDRKALVVDVRWNGGGSYSQSILARLRPTVAGLLTNRFDAADTLPDAAFNGPKVALINQFTVSDGEQFAYFFKKYRLGRVIGTRTWGGVRGVEARWLLDGGFVTIIRDALASTERHWLIENHGVDPEQVVDDLPDGLSEGHDAQLMASVARLNEALDHPTYPTSADLTPPPFLPAYPENGNVHPSND